MTGSEEWLSLRHLASISDFSVSALKRHIKDPIDPLPSYRKARKLRVKRDDFEKWMEAARDSDVALADAIVARAMGKRN